MGRFIRNMGYMLALYAAVCVASPYVFLAAKPRPGYDNAFRRVEYVANYDGDTITIDIGDVAPVFGKNIPVRVAHINTAELDSKDNCEKASAILAKDKVQSLLRAARRVDLVNVGRDKYFRLLADIIIEEDLNLGSYLLQEKLAVPYEGGTKPATDWCQYPPNKK